MLASIASFYPQLSNTNGSGNSYFTNDEKNIQNEMELQQQNDDEPIFCYYFHNSEHHPEIIFPQIQEFFGSQLLLVQNAEDELNNKQFYNPGHETSQYCPDLNTKTEIVSMEEDSSTDDDTTFPKIQEIFGGEEAQLLIEGATELLCKQCHYPGHETFQCPSLYMVGKEMEGFEIHTDEESSKMLSSGDVSEFKNEIPYSTDMTCPHMPLKKRGKLS